MVPDTWNFFSVHDVAANNMVSAAAIESKWFIFIFLILLCLQSYGVIAKKTKNISLFCYNLFNNE